MGDNDIKSEKELVQTELNTAEKDAVNTEKDVSNGGKFEENGDKDGTPGKTNKGTEKVEKVLPTFKLLKASSGHKNGSSNIFSELGLSNIIKEISTRRIPKQLADTSYFKEVVGSVELRKGEGMLLAPLIQRDDFGQLPQYGMLDQSILRTVFNFRQKGCPPLTETELGEKIIAVKEEVKEKDSKRESGGTKRKHKEEKQEKRKGETKEEKDSEKEKEKGNEQKEKEKKERKERKEKKEREEKKPEQQGQEKSEVQKQREHKKKKRSRGDEKEGEAPPGQPKKSRV